MYQSASRNVDNASDQRWTNINDALRLEASMRGTNKWDQHPISAQFLAALARSYLPEDLRVKGQEFAVVDVLITAGKGRKFGPDTSYLTVPTRLSDMNFSGVTPVIGHP